MADYRKMWEELGMDVELHDQLCAVLPQAFGDVFLSQENRPDSMDYYNMVVADIHGIRPAELMRQMRLQPDYAAVPSSGFLAERKSFLPIPVH